MPACQARPVKSKEPELRVDQLDLAQLALFVGQRADSWVLERLHARGFAGVRSSHGYVIQHVVSSERSISELAERMGVSQQAASKVVRELVELGYLELATGSDARRRVVGLSARGRALLKAARALRGELERTLLRGQSQAAVAETKAVLIGALEELGGVEAIEKRRVREPG